MAHVCAQRSRLCTKHRHLHDSRAKAVKVLQGEIVSTSGAKLLETVKFDLPKEGRRRSDGGATGLAGYDVEWCRARIAANDTLNAVPHRGRPTASSNPTGPPEHPFTMLKDTWDTAGIMTTGGSWRHRNCVPATSSHIYRALRDAGAVLLGEIELVRSRLSTESDNHMRAGPESLRSVTHRGRSARAAAAAVADGNGRFGWGLISEARFANPAAWCGSLGLRPPRPGRWVHHFPRLPPFFWEMWNGADHARRGASRVLVEGARATSVNLECPRRGSPGSRGRGCPIAHTRTTGRRSWPTTRRASMKRGSAGRSSACPRPPT